VRALRSPPVRLGLPGAGTRLFGRRAGPKPGPPSAKGRGNWATCRRPAVSLWLVIISGFDRQRVSRATCSRAVTPTRVIGSPHGSIVATLDAIGRAEKIVEKTRHFHRWQKGSSGRVSSNWARKHPMLARTRGAVSASSGRWEFFVDDSGDADDRVGARSWPELKKGLMGRRDFCRHADIAPSNGVPPCNVSADEVEGGPRHLRRGSSPPSGSSKLRGWREKPAPGWAELVSDGGGSCNSARPATVYPAIPAGRARRSERTS